MRKTETLLSLDVGEKRIGLAIADTAVKIAIPFSTILVDGSEVKSIIEIVIKENVKILVIGFPRNQQGETTAQTRYVEKFAQQLKNIDAKVVFQDESLTSVLAEQKLIEQKRPYQKGDIDAQAAAIILQDYLEKNYR